MVSMEVFTVAGDLKSEFVTKMKADEGLRSVLERSRWLWILMTKGRLAGGSTDSDLVELGVC